MARIVMKFGGTSMAGMERIRNVAARVKHVASQGNEVAVVVSAMRGETDRLVGFCKEASPLYDAAEYDVVVASGEQVTSGLLAMTLKAMGVDARSWLGWQLPIHTVEAHAKARVQFKQPIANFHLVKEKLARISAYTYAMDAMTQLTAGLVDRGEDDYMLETAMLKVFASDKQWEVLFETMQIFGGRSFFTDEPFERMMRDARLNTIGEGSNDVPYDT